MPIEIREISLHLDEPRINILENVGDREYLGMGPRGVVVRVEAGPEAGRDEGIVEFNPSELEITKNGKKVTDSSFSTKPGDEIIVKKKGNTRHFEIHHTLPEESTT